MEHPILPLELERLIFELSALSWPLSVPNLMLVAWRVKQWTEPLLYQTLIINAPLSNGIPSCSVGVFTRIVRSERASLLKAVQNLTLVVTTAEETDMILNACPGVKNLNIFMGIPRSQFVSPVPILPLKRLYCDLGDRIAPGPFSHGLFAHLTHLHLSYRRPIDQQQWGSLVSLPRLTHLAFEVIQPSLLWKQLLGQCKSLCALIYIRPSSSFLYGQLGVIHGEWEIITGDPRFVMLVLPLVDSLADWQRAF